MFEDYKAKRELRIAERKRDAAKAERDAILLGIQRDNLSKITNSGYSNGGASKSDTWARRYNSESKSAESDIEKNRKTLRERTRDLSMNAPIAAASINTIRTSVVGPGLTPRPKIDYDFLGISKEYAEELQRRIRKEFSLWADRSTCDANDLNSFYELQQIAMLDWLKNGEEFVLIKYEKELPYFPYQLRLKLIEADRVCTPNSIGTEYTGERVKGVGNNSIMNGIEIDPDGKVVAYHICSGNPSENAFTQKKWSRVEKRGRLTGNPNILHIFNAERADQYRGVPLLAPVIHSLKQLTKYTEAEIMAAVVNSMLTIFVTTEFGQPIEGFGGLDEEEEEDSPNIELGSGTINFLKDGEKVQPVESTHPSGSYDNFVLAICNQIGAALEIAPEVLLKRFSASFSASKGALNETWKSFQMRRKWFITDFCQPVYELWFAEAVSKGRIKAPGFFDDILIRSAYTNATWNGPAQGSMNPVQDVTAAEKRIYNGLSTHEDECAVLTGSDFDDNVRTLINENEKLAKANKQEEK